MWDLECSKISRVNRFFSQSYKWDYYSVRYINIFFSFLSSFLSSKLLNIIPFLKTLEPGQVHDTMFRLFLERLHNALLNCYTHNSPFMYWLYVTYKNTHYRSMIFSIVTLILHSFMYWMYVTCNNILMSIYTLWRYLKRCSY